MSLYVHFVIAVKYKEAVIAEQWENQLHKYIAGAMRKNRHKLLAINTLPDHLHLFAALSIGQSVSDLMQLVMDGSSAFINNEGFTKREFFWQEGYGAFSHSHSEVDSVVKYILNQKDYHKNTTFREEYIGILESYDVEYDEKYIFDDLLDG